MGQAAGSRVSVRDREAVSRDRLPHLRGPHARDLLVSIVAALTEPRSVCAYLDGVGLPSRAPPIAPAHLDRQLELEAAA